eukprot:g5360.t1
MESETRSKLGGKDDDVDVDHYFLPGGILDTHHEEDMIGGSLLDEIGGAGNVKAELLPAKQMAVSRVVGSAASSTRDRRLHQLQRKPTSVISAGPTQLSVEGTNPMAKEFTPSSCATIDAHAGGPHSQARRAPAEPPNRVFSTAVGSEVKTTALEQSQSRYSAVRRQLGKLPRPPGPVLPSQSAAEVSAGDRGQQHTRHQQGGTSWPIRAAGAAAHPGPMLASKPKHVLGVANQGHISSPPGFPPRGGVQHKNLHSGLSPGTSQRRDRVVPNSAKHHGGNGTWDSNDRAPSSKAGTQFAGIANSVRLHQQQQQQHRRARTLAPFPQAQTHEQSDNRIRSIAKAGNSAGRDRVHDEARGRTHRVDQNQAAPKGPSRSRTQTQQGGRRVSHAQASSRRPEVFIAPTARPTMDSPSMSAADEFSQRSASSSLPRQPGQEMSRQGAARLSSAVEHQDLRSDSDQVSVSSSDDEDSTFQATSGRDISHQPSSGRWTGNSSERSARQAKSEYEPSAGHSHSHAYKEKDKAKMKKKDDKSYRPPSKHPLGTATKEHSSNRAKMGARSRLSQRMKLPSGYVRSLLLSIAAAFVRMITDQLNRLRLVRRMLALVSFVASSGVFLLSVVIMSTSWLFLLGLRLHSLALKEVTGSVHVAVCFLFPYCFQYLVSAINDWAPHWLPACLWYSFLMQMFCTSNHQYKHSMSSHLVPALRALLPVAFLCEVPSGRSYLLALGGSELLLLSFALAAVRLRCVFSPIFLLSWAAQVFALATCGPSASLQYGQLLFSLASLHAVSMVDVMLNSRFYHARYRAGMSLTNGFRTISSPNSRLT